MTKRRSFAIRGATLVAALLAVACGGGGGGGNGSPTAPAPAPSIVTFEASGMTLTWQTTGCDRRTIDPGIGEVAASGSRTVSVETSSVEYQLSCFVQEEVVAAARAIVSLCDEGDLTIPPCLEKELHTKLGRWGEQYQNNELPKLGLSGTYTFEVEYNSSRISIQVMFISQFLPGGGSQVWEDAVSVWIGGFEIYSKRVVFEHLDEKILEMDKLTEFPD